MEKIIYTATGCSRCKIAKKFMGERGITYQEFDIKGEGKDAFGQFYRNNRGAIFRGKEGVEFPVFFDGGSIRQGVGVVVAYLHAGTALDDFIGRSDLSHGWMDGVHVSGGDPSLGDSLILVLDFLKRNGLKLQMDTDGRNASLLERLLQSGIGDRVIMEVKVPLATHSAAAGGVDPEEVKRTIALVAKFPEYRFITTIGPVVRGEKEPVEIGYITPEEIGEAARLIQEATGSPKQPYLLRSFDPQTSSDERLKSVEKLPAEALFKYRSAARKFQVTAEIEKPAS
ncbi:MAG: hypothetical protein C4576_05460 [Desulfobacteraceae bacterium]|nr:MAG: hypothetical protein C4576_05460 [Desulfobacteraceae bacterium]